MGSLDQLDGYRMAARIESGRIKLLTHSELDWTAKYPAAVMATLLVVLKAPLVVALAAGVATGALASALQAMIVLTFEAPSFLVTLGGSLALQGILILILPLRAANVSLFGTPLADLSVTYLPSLATWACWALGLIAFFGLRYASFQGGRSRGVAIAQLSRFEGVPAIVALFILILLAAAYLTTQTKFGVHLLAVGGNREAARRAGVKVDNVVLTEFALAGALAAVSGVFAAVRQLSVSSTSGGGFALLDAIAAAVIGGASLFGGRGSVWAAPLGALVLATITNGLDLLGVANHWKLMAQGSILVFAIVMDSVVARGRLLASR